MRVIVFGGGGHGHVVIDALEAEAAAGCPRDVVAVLDDAPALQGIGVAGRPVHHGSMLQSIPHDGIIVAIGDNGARRRVQEALAARGERLITVRHPSAVVSRHAEVNDGTLLCAGAIVGPQARVGVGVIVNTGARIDHHCEIGAFVHIGPGATLAGCVSIGDETLVGMGACILPGVRIGARAIIGAGAVIRVDVDAGATVVGVPGRVVR